MLANQVLRLLLLVPLVLARNRKQLPTSKHSPAREAAQIGLGQFNNLLSIPTSLSLQTALAILPDSALTPLSKPVIDAFSAVKLTAVHSEASTIADAENCLLAILSFGTLPQGSACVDNSGNTASTYAVAFDTVLEQFVGVFPPSLFSQLQKAGSTLFLRLGLIPPINDLFTELNNALASVIASNSGNSVDAVERFQGCFQTAVKSHNFAKSCFTGPNSSLVSLNTLFAGVVQQFVGSLPPNVINAVINIYSYEFSKSNVVPGLALMKTLDHSLESVAASTSGNGATFVLQLTQCFNGLVMSADPSAVVCLVGKKGPVLTLEVLVNGIIQQGFGYFPPTVVLQLQAALAPYLTASPSPSTINQAFKASFKVAGLGPAFTACTLELEDCINNAVLGTSVECNLASSCKPLSSL